MLGILLKYLLFRFCKWEASSGKTSAYWEWRKWNSLNISTEYDTLKVASNKRPPHEKLKSCSIKDENGGNLLWLQREWKVLRPRISFHYSPWVKPIKSLLLHQNQYFPCNTLLHGATRRKTENTSPVLEHSKTQTLFEVVCKDDTEVSRSCPI